MTAVALPPGVRLPFDISPLRQNYREPMPPWRPQSFQGLQGLQRLLARDGLIYGTGNGVANQTHGLQFDSSGNFIDQRPELEGIWEKIQGQLRGRGAGQQLPPGVDPGGTYYKDPVTGNPMYGPPMPSVPPGMAQAQVMPTPIDLSTGETISSSIPVNGAPAAPPTPPAQPTPLKGAPPLTPSKPPPGTGGVKPAPPPASTPPPPGQMRTGGPAPTPQIPPPQQQEVTPQEPTPPPLSDWARGENEHMGPGADNSRGREDIARLESLIPKPQAPTPPQQQQPAPPRAQIEEVEEIDFQPGFEPWLMDPNKPLGRVHDAGWIEPDLPNYGIERHPQDMRIGNWDRPRSPWGRGPSRRQPFPSFPPMMPRFGGGDAQRNGYALWRRRSVRKLMGRWRWIRWLWDATNA